jgi:hypothetical protein
MPIDVFGVTVQQPSVVLMALIAGLVVPFNYAMVRLRGLGRSVFAQLPYKPPGDPRRPGESSGSGGRSDPGDPGESTDPALKRDNRK